MTTHQEAVDGRHAIHRKYRDLVTGVAVIQHPTEPGSWAVRLTLRSEVAPGTIASELDGITIVTEVGGPANLL